MWPRPMGAEQEEMFIEVKCKASASLASSLGVVYLLELIIESNHWVLEVLAKCAVVGDRGIPGMI